MNTIPIVYENEEIIIINKPAGVSVQGGEGIAHPLDKELPKQTGHEIFLVHRLDKDTSGLIITAKNRDAEEWLGQQFARRFVQKEYIAIVKGRPPALAGDIKTQIIRDPKNRKRFKAATQTEDGKSARTIYRCIASYGNYSLMRVRLKTGRTHQIRVHMKYIGCPILGDTVYGKKDDVFPEARLMLHAKKLTIRLPGKKKFSTFRSAVPDRFRTTLSFLKKNYPKEVPVWGKNHAKKKR